jgi:hypothetical protein
MSSWNAMRSVINYWPFEVNLCYPRSSVYLVWILKLVKHLLKHVILNTVLNSRENPLSGLLLWTYHKLCFNFISFYFRITDFRPKSGFMDAGMSLTKDFKILMKISQPRYCTFTCYWNCWHCLFLPCFSSHSPTSCTRHQMYTSLPRSWGFLSPPSKVTTNNHISFLAHVRPISIHELFKRSS